VRAKHASRRQDSFYSFCLGIIIHIGLTTIIGIPAIPTFPGTSAQAIGNKETVEPSVAHQNHSVRPGPEVFRSVRRMGILQLRPCPRLPLGRGARRNKN
jgi:hypothetical protein